MADRDQGDRSDASLARLLQRGSRPKGPEPVRFEAPRPNALWQMDYAEVRVGPERLHLLVVLDDFSRFAVGHALCESPSGAAAIEVLREAMSRHGKPESIRTDRGGGFLSAEFTSFLENELVDPMWGVRIARKGAGRWRRSSGPFAGSSGTWSSSPIPRTRPVGSRKFLEERSLPKSALRPAHFSEVTDHSRAHMGVDGVTPGDRYIGRADRVLALVDAISRRRQGVPTSCGNGGGPVEELIGLEGASPLEVLRLVLLGDELELRFCGARFRLGRAKR